MLKNNYNVIGTVRSLNSNLQRLEYHRVLSKIKLVECNFLETDSINNLLKKYGYADEFYNLAAISFVHSSFFQPRVTLQTNASAVIEILENIKNKNTKMKFYQATTSEIYGNNGTKKMNENSLKNPASPYAISKLTSHHLVRMYREAYGIFCCNGILFNHESPLRGDHFVTKKITKSLARYVKNLPRENKIGNIYSKRDWGFAGDFVIAMHKILQKKNPDDYVIATNQTYSIKDFIEFCLRELKIEFYWEGNKDYQMRCIDSKTKKIIFRTHKDFYRPLDLNYLKGDYTKANKELKWKPKVGIKNLIKIMLEYDLKNES